MNKQYKDVLQICISLLNGNHDSVKFEDIQKKSKLSKTELQIALRSLANLNLISISGFFYLIIVTLDGRNYFISKREETIDWLKNSILVPILVSAFTTFIIWGIPRIPSLISMLLKH